MVAMPPQIAPKVKIRVFVDYWNFQLNLHRIGSTTTGDKTKFSIDWKKLGPWLALKACESAGIDPTTHSYDGMAVYTSFDPKTDQGKQFNGWAMSWLNRQVGVDVKCLERKARTPQKCTSCYKPITLCHHSGCQKPIFGTVEKGVDTLLATDMIRLAWEGAYDIAVLASSDSDLVPAAEFLNVKGRKVIQAGFPPGGSALATSCWGSFDVAKKRHEIELPPKSKTHP